MTNGVDYVGHFVKDHICKSIDSRSGSGDSCGVIFLRSHHLESPLIGALIKGLKLEPNDYMFLASDSETSFVFEHKGYPYCISLASKPDERSIKAQEFGWAVIEMEVGTPTADVKSELSALLERVRCPLTKRHDVLYYRPLKGREDKPSPSNNDQTPDEEPYKVMGGNKISHIYPMGAVPGMAEAAMIPFKHSLEK